MTRRGTWSYAPAALIQTSVSRELPRTFCALVPKFPSEVEPEWLALAKVDMRVSWLLGATPIVISFCYTVIGKKLNYQRLTGAGGTPFVSAKNIDKPLILRGFFIARKDPVVTG